MQKSDLLSDIEAFLAETGMGAARFGFLAVHNYRLVERLRQAATPRRGRPARVWPETEERVRAFMASVRAARHEEAA